MTGQLFISLLNPGISLLLSLAFLLLWLNQREQTYVLYAAIAYGLSILAFMIQDVLPPWPNELHRIPSNLLFLTAASGLVATVVGRYGKPIPFKWLAFWIALGMAGHIWFLLVQHNISARILIVGAALSGITALIVTTLWRMERRTLPDKLLFWLAVATAINFVLRPLLIIWIEGGYDTYEGFQQSLFWTTVQFTQALISVSFALLFLVAVATDLVATLKRQATIDQLSGLFNRRGFEEVATQTITHALNKRRAVGLLIADFDHFKAINDSFGHAAGDAAIAAFGKLVEQSMPNDAIAGRIGGEEFALLVPDVDGQTLKTYAEFLRTGMRALGQTQLPHGADPSLSIGLTIGGPGSTLSELLSRADAALYEAKRGGRDRISVAQAELRLAATADQPR